MKAELTKVKVKDIVAGFSDSEDGGTKALGGKLDIRPPYQREFVYGDKQRDAVIDTALKGFPLGMIYWNAREDGTYEVLDGQQRTMSLCKFAQNDFPVSVDGTPRYFNGLPEDVRQKLLDYELMVYVCSGEESEKLDWFRTINIAGEALTDQELRNAVYSGPWVSDARRYFSKVRCPARLFAEQYVSAAWVRQEGLEKAIKWACGSRKSQDVEKYMAEHQHDPDASGLWMRFQTVVNWAKTVFPTYYRNMRLVDWGELHSRYGGVHYVPSEMDAEVKRLMEDREVSCKAGIYEYLLSGKTIGEHLHLRQFEEADMREAYAKQSGVCPVCHKTFKFEEMRGDHVVPWSKGGKTVPDNLQMLCAGCNARKSDKF